MIYTVECSFARWQPDISDWHRNIYDGVDVAPGVPTGEVVLATSTGPDPLTRRGFAPQAMHAVALEKNPERRWLASINAAAMPFLTEIPDDVHVYLPMTPQLTAADKTAAGQR